MRRLHRSSSAGGFTLIELLCVVGIMTLCGVLAAPTLSLVGASGFNKSTARASELLEEARAYAVAHNTYTWVAFYTDSATASKPGTVYVALLASQDGTSEIVSGATFGSYSDWPQGINASPSAANCQLIQKIEAFSQVGFADGGTYTIPSVPTTNAVTNPATSTPSFSLAIPGLGAQNFNRAIQFTPSGEAKVQAVVVPAIEFDLYSLHGTTASKNMAAVMRINGYTGQARVYLP
jgi:prepilin-type N-terminal cleavage/methylation domain-containing protein